MILKDSGDRTAFETGAVRDLHTGKGRMDLLPWAAIIEVSKQCEEGALKYGEHNVDKGIPIHSLVDSACRHLAKYIEGMDDEPHLRAAAWNILWALQEDVKRPDMQDLPAWQDKAQPPGQPDLWSSFEHGNFVLVNNEEAEEGGYEQRSDKS